MENQIQRLVLEQANAYVKVTSEKGRIEIIYISILQI